MTELWQNLPAEGNLATGILVICRHASAYFFGLGIRNFGYVWHQFFDAIFCSSSKFCQLDFS